MKSKKIYPWIISILLILLIVAVWIGNNQEIDRKSRLSLETNTVIPVNVTKAQWTEMNLSITATGKIVADNSLTLISKAQGVVLAKYAKAGERVTKGTPIAKVEDHLIRENLRVAEANYAKAKKDAERYESLQKAGAVTKTETEVVQLSLKNAEQQVFALKDQLQNTLLTAPVSGILENVLIEEGSLVSQGMAVAEIIDPSRLKMEIAVTEREIGQLKRGQKAKITSDVFAGKVFEGTVGMTGVQGDGTMSYKAEIILPAPQDLKPGMFAVAHIQSDLSDERKKRL
ncbi:MAG: efflux RND transporter periplasmic adaptor subunit, partial [Prevotellaceae bacterium]|nr:efflux RND transporter periplasmic adaptor subunit [Prevotellaceae bacterium]